MSHIKVKPSLHFSISTYEERQRAQQLRNNDIDRDQPDSVVPIKTVAVIETAAYTSVTAPVPPSSVKTMPKNIYLSDGKSSPSPPPPPPPEINCFADAEISPPIEFADDVPKKTINLSSATLGGRATSLAPADNRESEKPATPTPDYDSLIYNNNNSTKDVQQPVKVSAIPPPPPPMQKLNGNGVKAGKGTAPPPPKPNRSISVTIGEYDSRREPSKLDFLNKSNNFNGGVNNQELLQNELQMTLSRSNLRKTSEGSAARSAGPVEVTKSVLDKTGSANVEKLTAMLNARSISGNTGPGTGLSSMNGGNRVTISIPKTKPTGDSEVRNGSPNGILKTNEGGSVVVNGETKNIKFDNIATVYGGRK